jgi:predicted amidohydrolase
MDGFAIDWMKNQAAKTQAAICGSLVIEENNCFYNRLVFVLPDGTLYFYNKRHLFALANEHLHYAAGNEKVIVPYKGWQICLQICYDLRFPAFVRNHENYDLIIYVANWPNTRINAWDILLKARAIENMCTVIGVNRVGTDENGLNYSGHSQVIDELGVSLISPFEEDSIKYIELNKNQILETRQKLPFLNDKDAYTIK